MLIEYPYLFGSLILLIVWLLIYAYRKDLRHQMLWFSPAVAIFGIISEHWFLVDYWNPPVIFHFPFNLGSPEDLIFGFAVGGIVCSLYEIVFNKRTSPENPKNRVWTAVKYGVFIFAFVEILTRMYLVTLMAINVAPVVLMSELGLTPFWLHCVCDRSAIAI